MNIYDKLSKIQFELKAPKSQYNEFGKYNYRNAEDILEAVKPLCAKYGAVVTLTDDIKVFGNRYYIQATATIFDTEATDTGVINAYFVNAYAREEETKKGMDGSQVTGAASSYARKYALNGLFAIDDTKDSDATNNGDRPPEKTQNAPKTSNKPKTYDHDVIGYLNSDTTFIKHRKGDVVVEKSDEKRDDLPFPMDDEKSHSEQIAEILVKQEYIDRLKKKMTETYGTDDFDSLNDYQFKMIKSMADEFRKKIYGV